MSNRQQGGTLVGVAIMGLLSALIVGPCVAPPLFGALIFIGQTGDAVLGGVALFALSLGMGAPLIAIGTSAGKLLPRAGAWMDAVKAVFGVAAAGGGHPAAGAHPAGGGGACCCGGCCSSARAVYLGATEPPAGPGPSGWTRLWKGLGRRPADLRRPDAGGRGGGRQGHPPAPARPGPGRAAGTAARRRTRSFKRIKTVADLDRELAAATAAGRPVMLDFYADWCVSCKEMERYTFSDPAVIAEMGRFVLLQADVTANDAPTRH